MSEPIAVSTRSIDWLGGIDQLLPPEVAVAELRAALSAPGVGLAGPDRQSLPTAESGQLLLMPATGSPTGLKVLTLQPDNDALGLPVIQGLFVLFDEITLAPRRLLDGGELTRVRTAAVSALATDLLARATAGDLVVFGTGVQAEAHVRALARVRVLRSVAVVGRRADRAAALVAAIDDLAIPARVGTAQDVRGADLVCCCTSAAEPLFDGVLLRPGTHVNAIGSHHPDRRELAAGVLRDARVVVEERVAALREAGDLILAIAEGALVAEDVVCDLAELVRGFPARRDEHDITVFKSVGLAAEDLILALAADRRASATASLR